MERLTDKDYDNFVNTMERLVNLPFSYKVQDFIFSYRKALLGQTKNLEIPKLKYDSDGKAYVTTYGVY